MTTAPTSRPVRHRGIVRLEEGLLHELIRLPEGQRITGYRSDAARLCIDVCVEGDGLPEVWANADLAIVNSVQQYMPPIRFVRWIGRGPELAEALTALVDGWDEQRDGLAAGDVLDQLRVLLAAEDVVA